MATIFDFIGGITSKKKAWDKWTDVEQKKFSPFIEAAPPPKTPEGVTESILTKWENWFSIFCPVTDLPSWVKRTSRPLLTPVGISTSKEEPASSLRMFIGDLITLEVGNWTPVTVDKEYPLIFIVLPANSDFKLREFIWGLLAK